MSGQQRDDPGSQADPSRSLSGFQHEARNQLNLIIGYLDLLDRTSRPRDAEQQWYIDQIRAAAGNLSAILEALRNR